MTKPTFTKASTWKGNDLKGNWQLNWKIDGVRVLWDNKRQLPVSRDGKPFIGLHLGLTKQALEKLKLEGDCEFFVKDWNTSVSIARTEDVAKSVPVMADNLYPLVAVDDRLYIETVTNPTAFDIEALLKVALKLGHEGLILRKGKRWLRVKPKVTADVRIVDVLEGSGKHRGRMGALVTTLGKVGTGFTDKQREEIWKGHQQVLSHTTFVPNKKTIYVGDLIEIEYTELTKNGLPRFPRFKRFRTDKETESRDDC